MNQGKKNKIIVYLLSFLIPVIVLTIVCALQGMYPFGTKSIMTGDVNYQFIDYLAYYKTILFGNNDFTYTFSKTIGGDMIGFSTYYLFSPFNLLLLPFSNKWLPFGLLIMIIIKCGLCGFAFQFMLSKFYGVRKESLLFSTTYALMGYIIVYFQLYAYFDNLMILPFLVLGIHRIFDDSKKKMCYLISLCLSILINFYIGWMLCLFSAIYFVFQMVLRTNHWKEWKEKKDVIISFLFSSIAAGGLCAFTLIPSLLSLRGEKNSFHLGFYRTFSFIDLFSRFYTDSFKGNISSCLPNIYCGVLMVILLILFFCNRRIAKKERILSGLLLIFLACNFYVNTLNVVWHGFNQPIGFPYRYSFLLTFLMLMFSYKGFIETDEKSKKGLFLYTILFIGYSVLILVRGSEVIGKKEVILDSVIGLLALIVLLLYFNKKLSGQILFFILFVVQLGDLSINAYDALNYFGFTEMEEYQTYIEDVGDMIQSIKDEDDDFYRIEKYFRRSHNDSMQFNYSGLTHYSSCEKKETIQFMGKMGFRDNGNWSFYNNGSTSFIDSLFGVKYILSQYDSTGKPYEMFKQTDSYTVFQNPNALPLVMTSHSDITNVSYKEDNVFEIQNKIANSMNGKDNNIFIPETSVKTNIVNLKQTKESDYTIYEKVNDNDESYIQYTMQITNPNLFYAYFSGPTTQEADIYLNGEKITNYFDKYKWDIMEITDFEYGDEINVRIVPNQNSIKVRNAYFYYEDAESLSKWYQDISKYNCSLEKITSSHLKGSVTAESSSGYDTVVFSIPYEESWKISIDGKRVQTQKAVNMFLSAKLPSGTHDIELVYVPAGRLIGGIVTLLFIAILGMSIFIERKKYN